ncbi:MAG: glycosyltransferase family 4 protein [Nitrososphaerota archaeon]
MKIAVLMYQTSLTKGQELVALRMVKGLRKQRKDAFLLSTLFHDGKRVPWYEQVLKSMRGYVVKEEFGVPVIRMDGYISSWPPRRIMLRDAQSTFRYIVEDLGVECFIVHSTLWNGPEELTRFKLWSDMMLKEGLSDRRLIACFMPHYQPPSPIHYPPIERLYREAWNSTVFPIIFKTADLILCTTPVEIDQMIELGADANKCLLYPGGVDEEAFNNLGKVDVYSRFNIPNDVKMITFIGTVEKRKNPAAIVKIANNLRNRKDVIFIVAGSPSDQADILIKATRVLPNFRYIGEISEDEKISLIRASYANIIMSRMEALGLTQLEFMYAGKPVITSAIGGQRWLIRNEIDGIHVNGPEDIEGATKAVLRLIDNEELASDMGKNAAKRAAEFTLSRITENLIKRLESL